MKKFLIVVVFIFLNSCSSQLDYEAERNISLNPEDAEITNLSQFIENVEFVKLSTEDGAYIGSIEKVKVTENRIYILDAYNSVALYVYDRLGNLLFKIANYGRGPGEFLGPYDFTIDNVNGMISIYDASAIKLSFYDINDGKFIKDELLDFSVRRFEAVDGRYVFYTDNRIEKNVSHNIIITDSSLNIQNEYLKIKEDMRGVYFLMPMNFSTYNQKLFFTPHSEYNIYKYEKGNFEKFTSIDFGKYKAPEEYYRKYEDNNDRWEVRGDAAYNVSNYLRSDKFEFFIYQAKTTTYYYLSSFTTDDFIHTNSEKLNNDLNIGPIMRWPNAIIENKLVWYQQPGVLLRFLNEKKDDMRDDEWIRFTKENQDLISFAQSLEGEENPYLMFIEIGI